ncbi:MAG: hypothetical protein PHR77_08395 [Kiritimatiellae bacterium]|nr:hypothetical protein [Kiritimatiellia bacterium]MDD5520528.1 hypothetical protein [Kiritimatiellia bacterium]
MKLGVSLVSLVAVVVSISLMLVSARAADEAEEQQAPAAQPPAAVTEIPDQPADAGMGTEGTEEGCKDGKEGDEVTDGQGQMPEASDDNVKADDGDAAPVPAEKPAEAPAEQPADDNNK